MHKKREKTDSRKSPTPRKVKKDQKQDMRSSLYGVQKHKHWQCQHRQAKRQTLSSIPYHRSYKSQSPKEKKGSSYKKAVRARPKLEGLQNQETSLRNRREVQKGNTLEGGTLPNPKMGRRKDKKDKVRVRQTATPAFQP